MTRSFQISASVIPKEILEYTVLTRVAERRRAFCSFTSEDVRLGIAHRDDTSVVNVDELFAAISLDP